MGNPNWLYEVMNRLGGESALRKAISAGGDLADLYWEESTVTSLVLEDGRLENVISGLDTGVGLRVLFDDRQAFASTNELSPAHLLDLAGTVARAVDQGRGLELGEVRPGTVGPAFRPRISPETRDTVAKVGLLRRAESAARGFDPRIKQVKVVYGDRCQRVAILNSEGLLAGDERVSTVLLVQVVAAAGDRLQVGYEPVGGALGFELFEEFDPEKVARTAAGRAIMMLEAEEAPSGTMPVVLSADAGGTMIHEAIGHGL
ncbi:MAG: TldD/PmbA family protein, partial [Thermodesulfobacteriota bacterium]